MLADSRFLVRFSSLSGDLVLTWYVDRRKGVVAKSSMFSCAERTKAKGVPVRGLAGVMLTIWCHLLHYGRRTK